MSGTARLFSLRRAGMPWLFLLLAGVMEVVWAYHMKQAQGFTRLGPSLVTLFTMLASFALLAVAMRSLPLGTAYTIWTGIGAVGAFLVGIFVLGEEVNPTRVAAAVLICTGLVLMKWGSME
jgi:quaternary ammonium compound-resistance protein SugE